MLNSKTSPKLIKESLSNKTNMDLRVLIRAVECRKTDNFFTMIQFEEVVFPSKRLRCEKLRTNICANSSGPRFTKNIFLFENVGLGNRLTLKIAVFSTFKVDESQPIDELIVRTNKQREIVSGLWCTQLDIDSKNDHPFEGQSKDRSKLGTLRWCQR